MGRHLAVQLSAGPRRRSGRRALASGNTVVFKPASDTPLLGAKLCEMAIERGCRPASLISSLGRARPPGQDLIDNDGIDGIVFTGSKAVGLKLMSDNAARPVPRPLIIEMGGKNPAIVARSADLDKASDGVMRSAFGAQGQKCSACSRVYIQREVREQFVELLVEKTRRIQIGNPLERDVWMGPVINQAAVNTYLSAVERAKKDGGRILIGGKRITEPPFDRGYFVEPTIIDGLPTGHPLFSEELFVPITVLAPSVDARRSARTGQSDGVRADGRYLLRGRGRAANILRPHSGRRHVRQSAGRRDDRRVAGRQSVRRLEGERIDGTWDRWPLLRAAVHARAKPGSHSRRLTGVRSVRLLDPPKPGRRRLAGPGQEVL